MTTTTNHTRPTTMVFHVVSFIAVFAANMFVEYSDMNNQVMAYKDHF